MPLSVKALTGHAIGDEYCFYGGNSPGNTYECGQGYGNCTWWAAHNRTDLNFPGGGRDAETWIMHAQKYKFPIGQTPVVRSIVVFGNAPVGHVAHVESVNADGSFRVSEQDYFKSFGVAGTQYATYYPSGTGYKRNNTGSVYPLLGFIYPTRVIKHESDDYEGALRLDRNDGQVASSCEDADRITYYRSEVGSNDLVIALGDGSGDDIRWAEYICQEAFNLPGGVQKSNLGQLLAKKNIYVSGGIGGGAPTHPSFTFSDLKLKNMHGQSTTTIYTDESGEINFSYEFDNDGDYQFSGNAYACVWQSDGKKIDSNPDLKGCDKWDAEKLGPGKDEDGDENFYPPTQVHADGYNLIVCAHESKPDDNDFDEALGCSDPFHFDLVQRVSVPTTTSPPPWGYSQSPCAQAGYTIEQCTAILETILD